MLSYLEETASKARKDFFYAWGRAWSFAEATLLRDKLS